MVNRVGGDSAVPALTAVERKPRLDLFAGCVVVAPASLRNPALLLLGYSLDRVLLAPLGDSLDADCAVLCCVSLLLLPNLLRVRYTPIALLFSDLVCISLAPSAVVLQRARLAVRTRSISMGVELRMRLDRIALRASLRLHEPQVCEAPVSGATGANVIGFESCVFGVSERVSRPQSTSITEPG